MTCVQKLWEVGRCHEADTKEGLATVEAVNMVLLWEITLLGELDFNIAMEKRAILAIL
jgi:hypothetical protein